MNLLLKIHHLTSSVLFSSKIFHLKNEFEMSSNSKEKNEEDKILNIKK